MSQFRLGDCSAVKIARKADPEFDEFCRQNELKFYDFFDTVPSDQIKIVKLSDGMLAIRERVGQTHKVDSEDSFRETFSEGPLKTTVTPTRDMVHYKLTFTRATEVLRPAKKRACFDCLVGVIIMGIGCIGLYLIAPNV
jgi:hypothetical protein